MIQRVSKVLPKLPAEGSMLDHDVLDELRMEFGVGTLLELLQLAKSSADSELDELDRQLEQGAGTKIRRIAHSLIGILGQYGALDAARLARLTQTAADDALDPAARALIDAGRAAIEELRLYADEIALTEPQF